MDRSSYPDPDYVLGQAMLTLHMQAMRTTRATYLFESRWNPQPRPARSAAPNNSQELLEHHLIRQTVITAQRRAVLDLRAGEIEDEIWRQIERDLDLEELRMG